jgi:UDP-N-acetylglucosamine 1-carboxyvinyltransferase
MGAQIDGIGSDTLWSSRAWTACTAPATPSCPTASRPAPTPVPPPSPAARSSYKASASIFLGSVSAVLRDAGVELTQEDAGLRVARVDGLRGVDVITEPFPGFATDMQAQFMALMAVAEGASMITETIFENRFMHVPELSRMGARINAHGSSAIVRGVSRLTGAPVMATDLRASVSLIIAGMAAQGRRWSTASTTSIAAMSGWRRSSPPAHRTCFPGMMR